MKIDVLQLLAGKKAESARKGKPPAPGFENLLRAEAPRAGHTPAQRPEREEKKPRAASTGTEEALLVSRSLNHARPAPLFVTKQPELKGAKDPKDTRDVKGAPRAAGEAPTQKAITLDQLVNRAKLQHEPARVTAPGEKKPTRGEVTRGEEVTREVTRERPRELKHAEDPAPTLAPASAVVAAPASETFRLEGPPALKEAAPLAPLAPLITDDPSLRIVLLPTIARMSLDAGDAGRLNVQLKVQDGITEVRASGPASQMFEARQGELRVALAKEGLALGHFDLTQSGSQQRHGERPDLEFSPPPTARRAAGSPDLAIEDGRVHVKA